MATRFEDRVHTPLSRDEAKLLVAELLQLVDDAVPSEATDLSYATSEPPPALEGLSIASRFDLEHSEDNDFGELLEDLEMSVLTEKPPTAEGAMARARATGYEVAEVIAEEDAARQPRDVDLVEVPRRRRPDDRAVEASHEDTPPSSGHRRARHSSSAGSSLPRLAGVGSIVRSSTCHGRQRQSRQRPPWLVVT